MINENIILRKNVDYRKQEVARTCTYVRDYVGRRIPIQVEIVYFQIKETIIKHYSEHIRQMDLQ